jgi:putative transcription factor
MEHQDWTTITLRKSEKQIKKDSKKEKIRSNKKNNSHYVSNKVFDDDFVPSKKVSSKLKTQIINARVKKGWSRKELANKCNLSLGTVREYESGKAIPNHQILNKLRRVLGCKLEKK